MLFCEDEMLKWKILIGLLRIACLLSSSVTYIVAVMGTLIKVQFSTMEVPTMAAMTFEGLD